jgi:glycosyltransferase involved in cell wall biosynthesis
MKVSILSIVYNAKSDLEETIRSVRNQKYKDIEFIVVDGGSVDGTVDVIKANLDIINTYVSEKDNGIYDAMNKGVKLANGDYLIFLNSGDYFYDSNVVSDIFSGFDGEEQNVIFGRALITNGSDKSWLYPPLDVSHQNVEQWVVDNPPNHQTVFFPHRFYSSNIFSNQFKIGADVDYIYRAILDCGIRFINLEVAVFTLGGISNMPLDFSRLRVQMVESLIINNKYRSYGVLKQAKTVIRYVTKYLLGKLLSLNNYQGVLKFFGGRR